ncbi:MAG: hypothetical protein K6E50_11035 [Lachnospiraceae bacterium]|nr:hypothetical protein [Lachnospiraceae bacterium]
MTEDEIRNLATTLHQCKEYYDYASSIVDQQGYNPELLDQGCGQTLACLQSISDICRSEILARRGTGSASDSLLLTFMTYGDTCNELIKKMNNLRERRPSLFSTPGSGAADEGVRSKVEKLLTDLFQLDWVKKYCGVANPSDLKGYQIKHPFMQKGSHVKMLTSYMLELEEFDTLLAALARFAYDPEAGLNPDTEACMDKTADMIRDSFLDGGDIRMAKSAINKYMEVYNKMVK